MKRFDTPNSLGVPTFPCPPKDKRSAKKTQVHNEEFQAMLDRLGEEDCLEESHMKKRRLSLHQVQTLEKNFDEENKLEPEQKLKLAEELGLQPRQVAVWFQNRRARWKTKQLERDYAILKANCDALRLDFDGLEHEKEALSAELQLEELKGKLLGENAVANHSVKEQNPLLSEWDNSSASDRRKIRELESAGLKRDFYSGKDISGFKGLEEGPSEDSDSSMSTQLLKPRAASSSGFNGSSQLVVSPSPANWFQMADHRAIPENEFQPQFVRMEEHDFYSATTTEESCNFFSVDQPPTLHW